MKIDGIFTIFRFHWTEEENRRKQGSLYRQSKAENEAPIQQTDARRCIKRIKLKSTVTSSILSEFPINALDLAGAIF